MLQTLIYKIKRAIHHHPAAYNWLFSAATFNLDYAITRLQHGQFPSRFGGLWTDRKDADTKIDQLLDHGTITTAESDCLRQFREEGFLILEKAIPDDLIDRYVRDLNALQSQEPTPLQVTAAGLEEPIRYSPDVHAIYSSIRTVDDYFFLDSARNILFTPAITRHLELLFKKAAVLTQTLSFLHGSQQHIHQDTAFVRMNSPMKLIGVWIALEDVEKGAGELLYIPGSHRWPDYLFSNRYKHYDKERDGPNEPARWFDWIGDQANRRNTPARHFLPKKGDVLFWHAGLAHGGAEISDTSATRRSLVAHFCPRGVRPLYHYYKPQQRKIHSVDGHEYTSSYYS